MRTNQDSIYREWHLQKERNSSRKDHTIIVPFSLGMIGSMLVSTYPSPNPTLTLVISWLLGQGRVRHWSEWFKHSEKKLNEPILFLIFGLVHPWSLTFVIFFIRCKLRIKLVNNSWKALDSTKQVIWKEHRKQRQISLVKYKSGNRSFYISHNISESIHQSTNKQTIQNIHS